VLGATTVGELERATADLPAPRRRALADPALRAHAAVFAVATVAMFLLWWLTRDPTPGPTDEGPGQLWPAWVTLVWALALAGHALRRAGVWLNPPREPGPRGLPPGEHG
jgi:hypothetical protein